MRRWRAYRLARERNFARGSPRTVPVDPRRTAIPSPTLFGRSTLVFALALASCGGGAERTEPAAKAGAAEANADSYVASFITEDAEACFGDVNMTRPTLGAKRHRALLQHSQDLTRKLLAREYAARAQMSNAGAADR